MAVLRQVCSALAVETHDLPTSGTSTVLTFGSRKTSWYRELVVKSVILPRRVVATLHITDRIGPVEVLQ